MGLKVPRDLGGGFTHPLKCWHDRHVLSGSSTYPPHHSGRPSITTIQSVPTRICCTPSQPRQLPTQRPIKPRPKPHPIRQEQLVGTSAIEVGTELRAGIRAHTSATMDARSVCDQRTAPKSDAMSAAKYGPVGVRSNVASTIVSPTSAAAPPGLVRLGRGAISHFATLAICDIIDRVEQITRTQQTRHVVGGNHTWTRIGSVMGPAEMFNLDKTTI